MIPLLSSYEWVVCHSSAGKDSQTALRQTVLEADRQGFPRERIVVAHQDLGRMEWKGTKALAALQALRYGLRFEVTRYRNRDGAELTLLDYVRQRGKWPSASNRFCTSEFKRGPGNRLLTRLSRERRGAMLQVFGFRAEESTNRAKKPVFVQDKRASTGIKPVFNWLPIHQWTEEQVWADIRRSSVPSHPAYELGMPRLSCCFCIFAPKGALMIAAKHNRELFAEYLRLEAAIGHDFQYQHPLRMIKEALDSGETPPPMTGKWNM